MRADFTIVPGVAACVALALAGDGLARGLGLPVPGPVVGLVLYLAGLALGRVGELTRPGAAFLLRWLGAMVVPALVGVAATAQQLGALALPVLALLVVTTLVTAVATALIWRWAGGRGW